MVSFDVVSLFTSIPVDLAKDIVRRKLKESDIWQAHTDLTSSQILGLLAIVLDNSYFKFDGDHYHQISGCAMGSPVSAVIAELVMQKIESSIGNMTYYCSLVAPICRRLQFMPQEM